MIIRPLQPIRLINNQYILGGRFTYRVGAHCEFEMGVNGATLRPGDAVIIDDQAARRKFNAVILSVTPTQTLPAPSNGICTHGSFAFVVRIE